MVRVQLFFKNHKILFAISILIIMFAMIFGIPSLAKLKNRTTLYTTSSWDGTIATSYKKGDGTKENPYVISNGSEFAFFIEQLKTTDYNEKYFELSNDIIINAGTFIYDESKVLKYNIDNKDYLVKENTTEYYDEESNKIGNINSLSMVESFKGNLNGNSFTIYGMYITNFENQELSLFKNLQGTITDLNIKNSLVYGDGIVAGIAINSENATLKNVIYDGNVINKSNAKILENSIEEFEITSMITETNSILKLPTISIDGNIKSIKLKGIYESSNVESNNTIIINGIKQENNNFEIDLGTTLLEEIPITTISTIDSTIISFSNLIYEIEYYNDITSGIIAKATNTVLSNSINKANIYGNYIGAGFIGKVNNSLKIEQSYNTGNVNSNYINSGIVGEIKDNSSNVEIINVYNTGISTNSFIGNIENNSGTIHINNSINTLENYAINTVNNSSVIIENSYSINGLTANTGETIGLFNQISVESLYNDDFFASLQYNIFINFDDVNLNTKNVWIYEKDSLPILYIDDLNNPIANLNINKYSWNNLGLELNYINIEKNLIFSIDDISSINPIKEKYYYVTSSRVPLTEDELTNVTTWILYEDSVTISESGYYVIYAKIVDYDNEVSYINSDIIAFNVTGSQKNISMDEYIWSSFKTDVDQIYTNKEINISIYAQDDLVPIDSIEYYISNTELTEEELNNISEWTSYTDFIKITELGKYIVYAKIKDVENNTTYINSDYIVYDGYRQQISLGSSGKNYNSNYITSKSLIKLDFESNFELEYGEGYTHNLISSILLPSGTEIILHDKKTNKIYKKTIESEDDLYGYNDSCSDSIGCSKYATYKFETFKEISTNVDTYYDESINYNNTLSNEKYTVIINLKNTNITTNYYDVSFSLVVKNNNQIEMYKTLNNTINNINIYSVINNSEISTEHILNSNYTNQTINYNSNSELNIDLSNSINYSILNNKNIIDTQYENKKVGLLIKLYDSEGKEINKKYLDNILFKVDDREFFASSKNEIRINLGNSIDENIKTLKIQTKQNSSDLKKGTYYIKINKFISDDGYYYNTLSDEQITIPLIVGNQYFEIPDYSFSINVNEKSIILNNSSEADLITFDMMYLGTFTSPNVIVSLYEKQKLTAYNQDYTLIDLDDYTNDSLNKKEEGKYIIDISKSQFNLNLITNKLSNNGYKYVFELYDGTQKISTIEKYFIVK